MTSNLSRTQSALKTANIPALLLTDIANVGWISGFSGTSAVVVVTPTSARFLTDSRYTIQAKEEVADMPTFSYANPVTADAFLLTHLKEMGVTRLAFEGDHVVYDKWAGWAEKLPGVVLESRSNFMSPLRMVKSEVEIEKIRKACELADSCFEHIKRLIQPGVVEFDIGLEIEFYFRRHGAEIAFSPIVVSGERSARPHGHPGDRRLQPGDFVTLDFGARLEGQCSDITRTVVVAEASDRTREVYNVVLTAQLKALDAMKPGVKAADVDKIARISMGEFAQYFGHGLGHGLGSVVHDAGRLSPTSEDVLEVGQVWTVEPGVYIPDFGGVRIEDDVVVTENGIEILTHSPKELTILP